MSSLTDILAGIDSLQSQLDKLKPMKAQDEERLWKKFRLEWNYNSNHIEGNTLTYGQTELLIMFDKTTGDHEMREYEEMKAHDAVIHLVREFAKDKDRELTEADIRQWNKTILVRPFWSDAQTPSGQPTKKQIIPGEYKKERNSVRLQNGEMFHYASPEETPLKMSDLITWYRDEVKKKELHPVQLAALLHYKFVLIHPFDDSNGRTSRLLMNYELLRNDLPPVIIKSADKKNYLFALNKADVGDVDAFVEYVANQLKWSLDLNLRAAKGEDIDEVDDVKKEVSILSKRLSVENKQIKHPTILNETFKKFSKNVWLPLKEELSQFNELFSERKEFHFVNYASETHEKKNVFESPFLKSTGPTKVKIFGLDIYEDDVEQIAWTLVMYGLKGAKTNHQMEVKAQLKFTIDSYSVDISVDYKTLMDKSYNYGDFILETDVKDFQALLSKHILSEIKLRIN